MKFRRLKAYSELDFECFKVKRNIMALTDYLWCAREIEIQEVKGYLINEWWMSYSYRQNCQFSLLLFKMIKGYFCYISSFISFASLFFVLKNAFDLYIFPIMLDTDSVVLSACRAWHVMSVTRSFALFFSAD